MSEEQEAAGQDDAAPGDPRGKTLRGLRNYLAGFALAALLTTISFWAAQTGVFWQPGVAIGLAVLAVAQIGIHLVFFLHLTTGRENINNSLAVAFGVLIVTLFCGGSLWIMANLNTNMAPMDSMTNLQMQR
ncbi:cytochrome o ubiquinol oxidase subunit IV [Sphingomonas bacterium]|uniref:cytochrome o ubiquinol oxidase subunit IV n=1 Tax=Sphingomonas bacterium TaxID=1895847 RepID=UPI001575B2EB|nr:cytochrome o ubiquinol oxidase subunit IV [Sphingomonas bacterium]